MSNMKLLNAGLRRLYWPICRWYSKHLRDEPADVALRFMCSVQFRLGYGFWPNFTKPKRFSEKVWSRQLHERNAEFTRLSDKYRVREYVAHLIGNKYLVPVLWDGTNPADIPFDELPDKFVIKANHGCGYNIIVHQKVHLDRDGAIVQIKSWLKENFGRDQGLGIAWAYKNIHPRILVEEMLQQDGRVPVDYKFFCFSGRMEYFKVDFNRFEGHTTTFFNRALVKLELVEIGLRMQEGRVELPDNLREMIRVAETLAAGFAFIRVDLYSLAGKIYFGELTMYPGGVSARFSNEKYDREFGEKWTCSP